MDPTALSNLDPKLKETYDRVMGTPSPTSDSSPTPTTPPADTTSSTNSELPTNELSAPTPTNMGQEPHPETVTISQPLPAAPSSSIVNKPHGHSGLIRVFYILGAMVFFVIYVFFWAKIFNIQLPF